MDADLSNFVDVQARRTDYFVSVGCKGECHQKTSEVIKNYPATTLKFPSHESVFNFAWQKCHESRFDRMTT